jgi:hypothetical protein
MVGTVTITVTETAANESDPVQQPRYGELKDAKFPYGFSVGNFAPNVPLVQFDQSVTLTWQGSVMATYYIDWGDAEPVNVSDQRSWPSHGLKQDTTFLLRAEVTFQGETVTRVLSTTVIVADPDLLGKSLVVKGVSTLEGTTTIGIANNSVLTLNGAKTTINSPTAVYGDLSSFKFTAWDELRVMLYNSPDLFKVNAEGGEINAPSFTFKKGASVEGGLGMSDGWSNGKFDVYGAGYFASTLEVKGELKLNGTMDSLAWHTLKGGVRYTAPTDGFLIMYVTGWGIEPDDDAWCSLTVSTPRGYFNTAAGTMQAVDDDHCTTGYLNIPIGKGESFDMGAFQEPDNDSNPAVSYYFVCFGNATIPEPEPIPEEQLKKMMSFHRKKKPKRKISKAADVAAALMKAVKTENITELENILRNDLGLE